MTRFRHRSSLRDHLRRVAVSVCLLPAGAAVAQDFEAVGSRLREAVAAGELTEDQAREMMDALRRTSERTTTRQEPTRTGLDELEASIAARLNALDRELREQVADGTITEAQARERYEETERRMWSRFRQAEAAAELQRAPEVDDGLIGGAVQPRALHEVPEDLRAVGPVVETGHAPFDREVTACGILLVAEEGVEDDFLVRVGRVVAELLPAGKGIDAERQEEVLVDLHAHGAVLPVLRSERSADRLLERQAEAIERLQARYSLCDIIMERVPDEQKVMEVLEHLLHTITDVGLHHAYPEEWGLDRGSELWAAMNRAIDRGYYDIGGYDDLGDAPQAVVDRILMQEFAYWFITTAWDLQIPYGPREREWTLRTPEDLRRSLPEFLEVWERTGARILRAPSRATLEAIGPARHDG